MDLSRIIIVLIFVFSTICFAQASDEELPLFITKQDIRNIRYISLDGSMTYYQRSNGSLQVSTNYNVREVIKLNERSQFLVFVSPLKKHTVISHQSEPYTMASSRWMNKLFLSPYGTTKTKEIGEGLFIDFHGKQDELISYYVPTRKKIIILQVSNLKKKAEISIIGGLNPYFLPEVALINEKNILFTDQNKKGISGLRLYNFKSKKSSLFYKAQSSSTKLNICRNSESLYLWESSFNNNLPGTRITSIPLKKFNRDEQKFVYQSNLNDRGNLICNKSEDHLYFIKEYKKDGKLFHDVAKHDIKKGKTKLISNLRFISSLINLDGRLLIPFQGKYYSLDKANDISKVDQLKKEAL